MAQVTVDGAEAGEIFALTVREPRHLIGAASSTIGTLAPDPTGLTIRAADGARTDRLQVGATVPLETTPAAEVVCTGHPVMMQTPESAPEPVRASPSIGWRPKSART